MPLIDSDKWIHKFVSLNSLRFHPENPRIPKKDGVRSEREIIEILCGYGDVELLAKEIVEKGWLRNDRLIALADGRRYVVYEGNRRLCALRLLSNPELAPKAKLSVFRRLAKMAKLPAKIAIEVVPSKLDAEIVMYTKHTGSKFIVPWKPLQQAAFVVARLEDGDSVEDLVTNYGLDRAEITRARAAIDLYRLVSNVVPSGPTRSIIDDPTKFPYSTVFDRLVGVPDTAALIGLQVTPSGLIIRADSKSLVAAINKLISDTQENDIDTRRLGTKAQALAYARELAVEVTENARSVDQFIGEVSSVTHKQESKPSKAAAKQTRERSSGRSGETTPLRYLLPQSVPNTGSSEKLNALRTEAVALNISTFPHAGGVLLRCILECGMKAWLIKKKKWGEVERSCSGSAVGPSLQDILTWVSKNRNDVGLNIIESQGLEGFLATKGRPTKFELDRIIHHPTELAHDAQIASLREQILPIITRIYTDT